MKKSFIGSLLLTAIVAFSLNITGCKNKTAVTNQESEMNDSTEVVKEMDTTYMAAIDRYLVDEIGKLYGEGDCCVPYYCIVDVDEQDEDDIKVWGDYWVFNYKQVGDTLKTVSGGNHPGLIHLKKAGNCYEVASFDQVADGAGNIESAKLIFGNRYDAFQTICSDERMHDQVRKESITEYVKTNNLTVTMFQDYGWPAVKLK